jgi:hypothetical protein
MGLLVATRAGRGETAGLSRCACARACVCVCVCCGCVYLLQFSEEFEVDLHRRTGRCAWLFPSFVVALGSARPTSAADDDHRQPPATTKNGQKLGFDISDGSIQSEPEESECQHHQTGTLVQFPSTVS